MSSKDICPCQSGKEYSKCCAVIIEGKQEPSSVEALMRSRYTAYTKGEVQHIINTTHPDQQKDCDPDSIRTWSESAEWKGLKIVSATENDKKGKVEFIASYIEDGKDREHHELSTFTKHEGKWYLESGSMVIQKANKAGRNDPCPCNSGKKYKKCCG